MPSSYSLTPDVQGEVAACSGTFGCLEALAGSVVALVLWAGLSTGLLFAPRANVRAALTALQREYDAVTAEQDALAAFATRVKKLSPAGPTPTVDGGGVAVVGTSSRPGGMTKLQRAYRETMMDVEHFERDYGESLPENLAKELGDGVAGAVLANDELSPQVKRAVLAGVQESRTNREQYLETLERERQRLDDAGDCLEEAATACAELDGDRLRRRSFDDLQARFERLEAERDTLTATLEARQEQVQDGVAFGWRRRDSESVYRYLYRDIDATYPVLADGTRVLDRMDTVEHRLTTALTAQP